MYIIYKLFFLWMKKKFDLMIIKTIINLSPSEGQCYCPLSFSLSKKNSSSEKRERTVQYFHVHILIIDSSRFMFARIVGIQPKSPRCTMSTWRRPIHTHLPSWSSMISDTSSSVTTTSQTCCSLATEKTTLSCHDL